MMMKMINNLFNFEKFIINGALLDQSFNEYLWQKGMVYWVQTFCIQSLFVLI
jgi:hypothetical protein